MLTEPRPRGRRGRAQQSLRQEYSEFLLQRIEEFKDQLSREQLLALADEAVRELEVGSEEQLVLTEVLVLEHVDRLIMRRLHLPTFRRWRDRHVRLRRAQREPTHWGLEGDAPLVALAHEFEEQDLALVVGDGAALAGFFLAAHDWPVVFIDRHLASVEAIETRAAAEALGRRFQAFVVSLGTWFPDVDPTLAVVDPVTLSTLKAGARARLLDTLKCRTPPGGVHCIPPLNGPGSVAPLSSEILKQYYDGWHVRPHPPRTSVPWFVATKP